MTPKELTQAEFDNLPVVNGRRQCPGNINYIKIVSFGPRCSFGERSSFGEGNSFGERSSFGKGSSFGERSSFGEWSSFGEKCTAISPYWGFVYPCPLTVKGPILLPTPAFPHWGERLALHGIKITRGMCYEDIGAVIIPRIYELLESPHWSLAERQILESWRA